MPPERKSARFKPNTDESDNSETHASRFIVMPVTKPEEKKNPDSKNFTNEDEIVLLKALRLFWSNGRNNRWCEFYGFIKEVLSHEFTRIQVWEKIRSMKIKFEANSKRARANGGNMDFAENHQTLLYELSKTLWGDRDRVQPSNIHDVNKHSTHQENKNRPAKKRKAGEGKNKEIKKRRLEENDASCTLDTTVKDVEEKKAPFVEDGTEEDAGFCKRRDKRKSKVKKEKKARDVKQNDGKKKVLEIQKMDIGNEEFESAFPLLRASFSEFDHPCVLREKCYLIGRVKGRELEEEWRELKKEELSLQLKRLDLFKRHILTCYRKLHTL